MLDLPDDPRRRAPSVGFARLVWLLLFGASLAGLTLAIWSLSDGMRAVMEIGGSCGDDPTYGFYQPCPDGVASSIMLGVFGGLFAAGVSVLAAWRARVPQLGLLAWPALFGVLGWNFLDFGVRATVSSDGGVPPGDSGLLICGVVFEAMAIIPVLVVLYFATIGRTHIIHLRGRTAAVSQPVSLVK